MKRRLFLFGLCLLPIIAFSAQPDEYAFGEGATVIETQSLTPTRSLVLWMMRPEKHPRDTPSDPYTCPEYTRGSFYSGPTRVSLVDPQTHRVINTLKIFTEEKDEFDIPYSILPEYYYHVEGVEKGNEGKPNIVWLKDYNGDGKAWEFALFDAEACMGLATTLIGYSEHQDKVVQYQTHLSVQNEKGKRSSTSEKWTDSLFSAKPTSPGQWKYEVDYRGRGGSLDQYEVHYDKQRERFEGKLVRKGGE